MKKITFGIIAHVDSGKTTLSESMLYKSGTIRSFGRVDKGESFLDTDSLERRRGITIYSKQASFEYGNTAFTMLDTPGHSDFSAEMERTLGVLDYAVLIISAADGIRGQTETLWKLLAEYEIPTFIFFNKMDMEGADRAAALTGACRLLDGNIVDFTAAHDEEFYDRIAMCSEEAMEDFLESGTVSDDIIRDLIADRMLFPAYFGSALKQDRVEELMKGLDELTLPQEYSDEFGARVFKIMRDDNGTRLTLMKITGGKLATRDSLPDAAEMVKIGRIRIYSGNRFKTVSEVCAGDVCAVEGPAHSHAGDGYGTEYASMPPTLMPVLRYRVIFPGGQDPALEIKNMRMIEEESPELSVRWDEDKRDIYICVMGAVQLEIIHDSYLDRFGTEISYDAGEIMYCETITRSVVGVGHFEPLRHYAEVHLLMEPLPEGSGLVFDTDVSVDELARNWQRLVLTHLYEKEHRGVLTGSPITDMKITLIAGRAHIKHTEGGDFRQATYRAVRQGLMMTSSKLLEPYYRFMISLPPESLGRAMTDLDRMGAEMSAPDTDTDTGMALLAGRAPVSRFMDYARDISAYTSGLGRVELTPDGYGTCQNEEEVIARIGYDPLLDTRNTPDSVFCSHGSGMIVPYDRVYDHMHIPFDRSDDRVVQDGEAFTRSPRQKEDIWLGTDEIDSIIAGISGGNRSGHAARPGWKRRGRSVRRRDTSHESPAAKSTGAQTMVFDKKETEYLLVDGYNVIFAWEELNALASSNIDAARDSLLDTLCNYQGMSGCEVIAVFDAYRVRGHKTEYSDWKNIHIVFTAEAETADAYIERFAHDNAKKHRVTVVTSDGLEQIIIRGEGCALISSREFRDHIDKAKEELQKFATLY